MRISTGFLAVSAAALVSLSAICPASAAGLSNPRLANLSKADSEKLISSSNAGHKFQSARMDAAKRLVAKHSAKKAAKADGTEPAPYTDVIEEAPAGTASLWGRNSIGYFEFWGMVMGAVADGSAIHRVDGEDGYVYLSNPCSQFPLQNFIRLSEDKDAKTLTYNGAQPIYYEADDEFEPLVAYLVPLKYVVEGEEDGEEYGWMYPADEFTYTLTYNEATGQYENLDDNQILGICLWDYDEYSDSEEMDYQWVGFGDSDIRLYPVDEVANSLPEGVTPEQWALLSDGKGNFANVAISDGKCYITDFLEDMPGVCLVGNVEGDKVTFPAGQFLGEDLYYMNLCYLYNARVEYIEDEDFPDDPWEEWYAEEGPVVMAYDADANKLSYEGLLGFSTTKNEDLSKCMIYEVLDSPVIVKQTRNPEAVPETPVFTYVSFDEEYEEGMFQFLIPYFDVDGVLLHTDRLYYEVYFNGDLYTFDPEDYWDLEAPMTTIPFDFRSYDIYAVGQDHSVFYYDPEVKNIGIVSVYKEDDKELRSAMAVYELSAVRNISDAPETNASYFNINGLKTDGSAKGLLIKKSVAADGSIKYTKIIR